VRFHDLRGTKVLNITDAQPLGSVDDVFLHLGAQCVVALRVRTGGLFGGHKALLLSDIKSTGQDAVTVEQETVLQDATAVSVLEQAVGRAALEGVHVLTENGTDIGTVVDLDADFSSGVIKGYVLGGGLMDRLQHVERLVPASTVKSIGPKIMVVADTVVPG
jgi:uncharacterized protein YrrD